MKKLGHLNDPLFDWSSIAYRGDSIHNIIAIEDEERFCVPKNCYLIINKGIEGFKISTKRKYVRRGEKMDFHELEMYPSKVKKTFF